MKNFVKGLITNRLGIVLATLNVCYFLSANLSSARLLTGFDKLMLAQNVPASMVTFILVSGIKFLFSLSYKVAYAQAAFALCLFFVTLQWLFIGWLAKAIAQKLKK